MPQSSPTIAPPAGTRGKIKNAAEKPAAYFIARESDGALNLVGAEASGTSVHMAGSSIDNGLDPLHVGLPGTVGTSVGVGNLNTKGYALATKITLRHSLHLPSGQFVKLLRQLERLHIIAKIERKSKSFFHFFLIIFRLIFFRSLV